MEIEMKLIFSKIIGSSLGILSVISFNSLEIIAYNAHWFQCFN